MLAGVIASTLYTFQDEIEEIIQPKSKMTVQEIVEKANKIQLGNYSFISKCKRIEKLFANLERDKFNEALDILLLDPP